MAGLSPGVKIQGEAKVSTKKKQTTHMERELIQSKKLALLQFPIHWRESKVNQLLKQHKIVQSGRSSYVPNEIKKHWYERINLPVSGINIVH